MRKECCELTNATTNLAGLRSLHAHLSGLREESPLVADDILLLGKHTMMN
jgi:hypothetical protein